MSPVLEKLSTLLIHSVIELIKIFYSIAVDDWGDLQIHV